MINYEKLQPILEGYKEYFPANLTARMAKNLSGRPSSIFRIIGTLTQRTLVICLILIVPTYAWRIPRVVSDWLIKTEFASAERIWFVMDCGSEIGDAAKYNRRLAEQKNLQYMGTAQIVMPENYIALFATPEAEEAGEIVQKAQPDVEAAIASVQAGRKFPAPRNNMGYRIMSGIINPFFYRLIVKADPFRVSDACVGCGQCASKCPLNNIELRSGKPVWGKQCTHYMACISYCPAKAIEYGKRSVGKPRYRFEELED